MSTPTKSPNALEQQVIEEQQMTPGRVVRYQSGAVTRTGRIVKVLSSPDETPRPPKVLYECEVETKRGKGKGQTTTKQYVNNPSMLRVLSEEEAAAEEEEEEGEEEEEEGEEEEEEGEGQAN